MVAFVNLILKKMVVVVVVASSNLPGLYIYERHITLSDLCLSLSLTLA